MGISEIMFITWMVFSAALTTAFLIIAIPGRRG